jgi:chromosomal replication initiation ATPase DnaA
MILSPADLERCEEIANGNIMVRRVVEAVSANTGISVADIKGNRRFASIAAARQLVYFVAHKNGATIPAIAFAMNRDVSTVVHGINAEHARRVE